LFPGDTCGGIIPAAPGWPENCATGIPYI